MLKRGTSGMVERPVPGVRRRLARGSEEQWWQAAWPFSGSPAISKRNCAATVTVDRRPREWASADAGGLVGSNLPEGRFGPMYESATIRP